MKLLPVSEAAAVLGISKRTLQQLTADRAVSFVKFGRNGRSRKICRGAQSPRDWLESIKSISPP